MIGRFAAYGFLKNLRFFEPFLYIYFLSKGFSFLQIGVLVSVREISVYVQEIPTGIVADMFGRKRAMVLCFCAYIASFLVFGFASSFYPVALAMVVFGTGEALRTGTHKAIIMDYLDRHGLADKAADVYGYTRSWSKIGSALNALLAAGLVFAAVGGAGWEYNVVFLASILPYLAGLVLILTYPPDAPAGDGVRLKERFLAHMKGSLSTLRRNWRLLVNSTLFDGLFKVSRDYIQPVIKNAVVTLSFLSFLNDKKREAVLIGAVYFLVSILSAVSSRWAGRAARWWGEARCAENLLFPAAGAVYLGLAWAVHRGFFPGVAALFLVSVTVFNIRRPLLVARIGRETEGERRATLFSVESMLKTLVVSACAPLVGWSADAWGLHAVFLVTGAGIVLFAFPLSLKPRGGTA